MQKDDNSLRDDLKEPIFMPNAELPINFTSGIYTEVGPLTMSHWHNQIEFVFVKEGKLKSNCGKNTVTAEKNDIIFINSNELHDYSIVEAPVELFCNLVDLSMLQGKFFSSYDSKYLNQSSEITMFMNLISNDEEFKKLFLSMWDEYEKKDNVYEYAVKSKLFAMITIMVRKYIVETISSRKFSHKKRTLHNINIVLEYIEKNYKNEITLDDLSKLLNINRFYFCRYFKEIVGCTPREHINNFRIHKAISLIVGGSDMNITEIATSVGYNDSNYFTKVFKSITLISPKKYRSDFEKKSSESIMLQENSLK